MKTQLSLFLSILFLCYYPPTMAALPSFTGVKLSESLETCLIRNSHRHLKDTAPQNGASVDGKDKVYAAEEEAWKDCRQGRSLEDDPWLASEVQIVRAKVRMQLTWELMNEHGV